MCRGGGVSGLSNEEINYMFYTRYSRLKVRILRHSCRIYHTRNAPIHTNMWGKASFHCFALISMFCFIPIWCRQST